VKLCAGLDNRWLVTLNSDEAQDQLLRQGLNLFNKKIKLRLYDDVLNDEYMEYQQYQQMQRSLYIQQQKTAATSGASPLNDDELSYPEGSWEQHYDQSQDRSGVRVVEPHGGPPTTAVNTPELPHSVL